MQNTIWILGDSPLVEEYAALCIEKGYEPYIRINAGALSQKLPDGAKTLDEADRSVGIVLELTNISSGAKNSNLTQLDAMLPSATHIFSSSVTVLTTEQATWLKHPGRLIGIGAFPTLLGGSLIEFAPCGGTDSATREAAEQFAASLGKTAAFVQDSIGLVTPRILCMLINEACFAMMEQVAEHTAIDTAMKLGTNYPRGPLEWGESIGAKHVHAVVAALHVHFGEDRYRCAPLLQKAALRNSFF